MRTLHAILVLIFVCARLAQAISIYPDLSDVRVAMTTNREIARGIATDGTNFLVVFQGDNLYASPDPTNQLAARLMAPSGSLLGARIDLARNGGVPLVAFGTSNYLVTWTENVSDAQTVRGQFLDRACGLSGASFLIASNTSAVEVGAMTFAAGTFWITWAQTNMTNGARILLQRVSEAGASVGAAHALSSANSEDQQFPALSAGSTNLLITWVARRAGTNQWDVLGRFIGSNGIAGVEFGVSETPALLPYPVAAAFDGTNYLAVWSRETGTARVTVVGKFCDEYTIHGCPILSTNQYPGIFARLLHSEGTLQPEYPVSTARWGQVSPSVVFDGVNYLLAWNDHRFANFSLQYVANVPVNQAWFVPPATNQTPYFCFIDRAGQIVDWEFIGQTLPPVARTYPQAHQESGGHAIPPQDFDNGARINTGPTLQIAGGVGAVLCNRRSEDGQTNDVTVTVITSPRPSFAQIKAVEIVSNYPASSTHSPPFVRVQIHSTNSHFIPQWSSNAVDWVTVKPNEPQLFDLEATDFIEFDAGNWNDYRLRYVPATRFFRALEDTQICRSHLREVARRKELWALSVELHYLTDEPVTSSLYESGGDESVCPAMGTLFRYGEVNKLPVCVVPFHELH